MSDGISREDDGGGTPLFARLASPNQKRLSLYLVFNFSVRLTPALAAARPSRSDAANRRRPSSHTPPFFFFFFFSPLSLITQMVTARAGIRSAGRRPMGEPLASPRSRAAVIGRAEAGKDGRSLRRSVSVMMKRPAAKKRRKKKQRRDVGNANPTRPF